MEPLLKAGRNKRGREMQEREGKGTGETGREQQEKEVGKIRRRNANKK